MSSEQLPDRLPGVLIIGLMKECKVCKNLENKGYIDSLHALKGTFLVDVLDMEVDGLPPPDTPAIFIIDGKYPNFKYFKDVATYERARTSGRDWLSFASSVRFFNRKISGNELIFSPEYVGEWSVDIMKKFCIESHIQFSQESQMRTGGPRIIPRYPDGE